MATVVMILVMDPNVVHMACWSKFCCSHCNLYISKICTCFNLCFMCIFLKDELQIAPVLGLVQKFGDLAGHKLNQEKNRRTVARQG